MKFVLRGLGTVFMFFGLMWFLQGIGVLPESLVAAGTRWAVYGAVAFLAGLAMLVVAAARRGTGTKGGTR